MKSIAIAAACVAATFLVTTSPLTAHEHGKKKEMSGHHAMSGKIQVQDAWARATPGLAKNGGAYFTAVNGGMQADRIVGVSSDMASRTELHTHLNDNGVMRMRQVTGGIEVPPGGKVTFKPGSYHIMFIGLNKPFKKGDSFPVTLVFEKAGRQTVNVSVKSVGAMKGGMDHGKKPMHGGHHGK
jgi:periplasmic copper chaperone A